MAVETITIDLDAYEAPRRRKRPGQSFSDVIEERFRGGATGRVLRKLLGEIQVDPSTLEAVEKLVRARSEDRATAPEL
jgi:predicted CopG family antitoxin